MPGRLLSVNVGLPRDVAWQGRTVHTGIYKSAVDGPRAVRRLNIDGDGQGDRNAHGGEHRAVFVYQIESYRYWSEQLGRDDFEYGQFGENFTVEGLADDAVCIGDRYRIGEALFEVTQPRVTCYRVGFRMDEPDMPALLVSHHRPGFYLRVLQEGAVQAGDAIERVASGPERMTVAEIDGLLYLPGRARRDLERALRIPALSAGWRGSFEELLTQARTAPAAPAWAGFRELRVRAVERESTTVTSFWLDAGAEVAPAAGQYLTIRVHPDPDGPALIRSYSISCPRGKRGVRISVKRDGVVSRYLHGAVTPGATLEAAAPRGAFTLDAQRERPVVLISAGVGATPVLAMLHALADAGMRAPVWWVHAAHDEASRAFGPEVETLLARLPDPHRVLALSSRGERLTAARLGQLGLPDDGDYYLCGPERFMDDISAALLARGIAPERVRTERFGATPVTPSGVVATDRPPPHQPRGLPGTGPRVSFARSGLSVPWGDEHGSLLEFAEACDVPINFGCRTGVCHACATSLLSGAVRYDPQPLEPPGDGELLMCCSVPLRELVLDA